MSLSSNLAFSGKSWVKGTEAIIMQKAYNRDVPKAKRDEYFEKYLEYFGAVDVLMEGDGIALAVISGICTNFGTDQIGNNMYNLGTQIGEGQTMIYKYLSVQDSIEHFAYLISLQSKDGYSLTTKDLLAKMAKTDIYQDVMGHAIISNQEIEKLYEEAIIAIISNG